MSSGPLLLLLPPLPLLHGGSDRPATGKQQLTNLPQAIHGAQQQLDKLSPEVADTCAVNDQHRSLEDFMAAVQRCGRLLGSRCSRN